MKRRHLTALTDPANDPRLQVIAPVDREVAFRILLEVFGDHKLDGIPTREQLLIFNSLADHLVQAYQLGHADGVFDTDPRDPDAYGGPATQELPHVGEQETQETKENPTARTGRVPAPHRSARADGWRCWHTECVSSFCHRVTHVDATGFTWVQPRGGSL